MSYLFAFSYCSWASQARILKWFAIPFSSGPCFVRILHHDPSVLGGTIWMSMAHGFIELDKAVINVISLISFLWLVFIADIHWIIEKAREFQKNIYFCFIDYTKVLTMLITTNSGKFFKRWEYQTPDLPPEKPVCRSRSYSYKWMWKNRLVPNRKRSTSRLYIVTLLV